MTAGDAGKIFEWLQWAGLAWTAFQTTKASKNPQQPLPANVPPGAQPIAAAAQLLAGARVTQLTDEAIFAMIMNELTDTENAAIAELLDLAEMEEHVEAFRYIIALMYDINKQNSEKPLMVLRRIANETTPIKRFEKVRREGLIVPGGAFWDWAVEHLKQLAEDFPDDYARFEAQMKIVENLLNNQASKMWAYSGRTIRKMKSRC